MSQNVSSAAVVIGALSTEFFIRIIQMMIWILFNNCSLSKKIVSDQTAPSSRGLFCTLTLFLSQSFGPGTQR